MNIEVWERKFQETKQESSDYFYNPDEIAKIPRSNCYFGKLATPRKDFCLQGCKMLVDRMMGKPAAFREISSAASGTTKHVHISNQRESSPHSTTAPWCPMQVGFSVSQLLFSKEKHISNFTPQAPFPANLHIIPLASSLTQG